MAFRWLTWQFGFFEWQRGWRGGREGAAARGPGASVDRVEGARARRRLLLAVVDGLVVAQAVQAGVYAPANVTDRLPRGPHVYVLNMPFEPGERGQALVTRLASVIFLGGAGATWSQHKQLAPSKLPNAVLMHSPYRSLSYVSTATPLTAMIAVRRADYAKRY